MSDRGWICPKCEAVHAPSVLSCSCPAKQSASDSDQQFWELVRQQPACPLPHYPFYQPYWYGQPAPRITYDTVTTSGNLLGEGTIGMNDPLKVTL